MPIVKTISEAPALNGIYQIFFNGVQTMQSIFAEFDGEWNFDHLANLFMQKGMQAYYFVDPVE